VAMLLLLTIRTSPQSEWGRLTLARQSRGPRAHPGGYDRCWAFLRHRPRSQGL